MRKGEYILVALAILVALPFLVFWPSLFGARLLYEISPSSVPSFQFWLYVPAFGVYHLFSDMARYVAFSIVAMGLTVAALAWLVGRLRGRVWRSGRFYLLAAAFLAVVAFPLAVRYRPFVHVAPEAELRMVEPPGWVESTVRACQAAAEIAGCQYEVLGWADARTLVYRKWCGGYYDADGWHPGAPGAPLAYDVEVGAVVPFEGETGGLLGEQCPASRCVLPALLEFHSGGYYLPGRYDAPTLSPDGRRVAFVARHIYGPEDLLVLSVNWRSTAGNE